MFNLIINIIALIVWIIAGILTGILTYRIYKRTREIDETVFWLSYATVILLAICNILRCVPVT